MPKSAKCSGKFSERLPKANFGYRPNGYYKGLVFSARLAKGYDGKSFIRLGVRISECLCDSKKEADGCILYARLTSWNFDRVAGEAFEPEIKELGWSELLEKPEILCRRKLLFIVRETRSAVKFARCATREDLRELFEQRFDYDSWEKKLEKMVKAACPISDGGEAAGNEITL